MWVILAYSRRTDGRSWWRRRLECFWFGHAWHWRFYYYPPKNPVDWESYGYVSVNADCDCCGAFRKEKQRCCRVLLDYCGRVGADGEHDFCEIRPEPIDEVRYQNNGAVEEWRGAEGGNAHMWSTRKAAR